VLDEYCCCYLTELREHSENGAITGPTLLHDNFAFWAFTCAATGLMELDHFNGRERFEAKKRLSSLSKNQKSHFRCMFYSSAYIFIFVSYSIFH
jgi:hypothetical protein